MFAAHFLPGHLAGVCTVRAAGVRLDLSIVEDGLPGAVG